jgi:hypothetical protein
MDMWALIFVENYFEIALCKVDAQDSTVCRQPMMLHRQPALVLGL